MKFNLFIIIILFKLKVFSQEIELKGFITDPYKSLQEKGYIFYSINDEPFSSKNFLPYNKNKEYSFNTTLLKIKAKTIEYVHFKIDTNSNDCKQTVKIKNILNSSFFKAKKKIKLKNDFITDMYGSCEVSEYYIKEEMNKFEGQYILTFSNTIRNISLANRNFGYSAKLSDNKNYMTNESGVWYFESKDSSLTFDIYYISNPDFGIFSYAKTSFTFKVKFNNDKIEFISDKYKLIKIVN